MVLAVFVAFVVDDVVVFAVSEPVVLLSAAVCNTVGDTVVSVEKYV